MLFRASKSHHWSKCAAYVNFTRDIPGKTNDAALEGTAIMSVIESVIKGDASSARDFEGETHRNGWLITKDMCNDAQEFINWLSTFDGELLTEQHVVASSDPHIAGTFDVCAITKKCLHVIDFKYGHRTVEVKNNPQLIIYAYGKAKQMGWQGPIKIWIYQPRCVHRHGIVRWQMFEGEKLPYEFEKLYNKAIEGSQPYPIATPGKYCKDCEAATKCVALRETTHDFVDVINSRETHDMNEVELSRELTFIDDVKSTIEAYFNAITTEAEERIKSKNIPGWVASPRYGKRKFIAKPETIRLMTGVDPYEKKLVTPAELQRRGADKEQVAKLTITPKAGMKIHRIDDDDIEIMFNKGKSK